MSGDVPVGGPGLVGGHACEYRGVDGSDPGLSFMLFSVSLSVSFALCFLLRVFLCCVPLCPPCPRGSSALRHGAAGPKAPQWCEIAGNAQSLGQVQQPQPSISRAWGP